LQSKRDQARQLLGGRYGEKEIESEFNSSLDFIKDNSTDTILVFIFLNLETDWSVRLKALQTIQNSLLQISKLNQPDFRVLTQSLAKLVDPLTL
jgi:hypothetical protein